MTTLGTVLLPQLPPERLRSVMTAAGEAGLEELWLWEDCFLEGGIATAAAALAWTEGMVVGIGLLPVPLRNVALTAMEVAAMERLFPGRLRVGLGHGVQDWMGQVGARVESPLTLLREYIQALRALLGGGSVDFTGRYVNLDRVELGWPPKTPPPLYAGAIGPKTLRMSGQTADGTILTGGTTPQRVREMVSTVDGGPDHRITVYVHAAAPGGEELLAADLARWGYPSNPDVYVCGSAEQVADGVRRWAEAGAHSVVLQPPPDDPDPEGFVRFVAQEVRPLLEATA